MARPTIHDDALRVHLLDVAAAHAFEQGFASLSLRSLAAKAGTTTAAIYTLFGNKGALRAALYDRAVTSFAGYLERVPETEDACEDIVQLGLAYRAWALDEPHAYRIMFGDAARPAEVQRAAAARGAATFTPLTDAVGRAIKSGQFRTDVGVGPIAMALWATVHGLVSIELGHLAPRGTSPLNKVAEPAIRAGVNGWRATQR